MAGIPAGAIVRAADRPGAGYDEDLTLISNINSTAYITGSPEVSFTFVGPTSGRILLFCGGQFRDNGTSGTRLELAPELRVGNSGGAVHIAASSEHRGVAGVPNYTGWHGYTRATIQSVTPGVTYYAVHMYRLAAASATWDINSRFLGVLPA